MLTDGLSRAQLLALAINALIAYPTLAANSVFEFQDWPSRAELFPMVLVSVQGDRKVALFPGTLQFTTTMGLVVIGRLLGTQAAAVGQQLEVLAGQMLEAILLNPLIQGSVQEFRMIETESTVRSDGKQQVGEASLRFEVVVYQEYGPTGDALTSITGTIDIGGGTVTPNPQIGIDILPGPTITPQ